MAYVRQNIAELEGTWNPTMLWYARAMAEMWRRPINDRRSWRYLAAIHGIDLATNGWAGQGIFDPSQESLPDASERDEMWDQCQHAGWYFLPWHRGYVAAFEAIVAQTVQELGGPGDWALPYWNYFDESNSNARRIPAAFSEPWLPDGSGNPLAMFARTPTQALTTLLTGSDINLDSMSRTHFTGSPGASGLGGSPTGFTQFGPEGSAGALENNPHNFVHVMAGGFGGYLSDPNYAALDPLFWLHHCNIDRLWSAWLTQSSKLQENGAAWLEGPSPRQFVMPKTDGGLQVFVPSEALPGGRLDSSYDDLYRGTGIAPPPSTVPAAVAPSSKGNVMAAQFSSKKVPEPQLLGSNHEQLTVGLAPIATQVRLAAGALPAAASAYRVYASLEGVKGVAPSGSLSVSVTIPGKSQAQRAEAAVLFGLQKASTEHGSNGLNISVDITEQIRVIAEQEGAMPETIEVRVQQASPLAVGTISVSKVSIIRQTDT